MLNMKKKKQEGGKNLFMGLYLFLGTLFVHIKLFLTAPANKMCGKKLFFLSDELLLLKRLKINNSVEIWQR